MDMYNWDIVCATSCEAVNYELEQSRNLMISDFSYTHDSGDYITGVFGNWQIVPGGSSQRINFITPIKKGKLSTTIAGKKIDIIVDGICPKLEIELTFVGTDINTETQLRFNCKNVITKRPLLRSGEGNIVILEDDINDLFPSNEKFSSAIFSQRMAEMIVDNQEKLKFVFSYLVNLPSGSEISWMKPCIIQYSYNESINGKLGSLGILAILEINKKPPKIADLQLQFDPFLIAEGSSVGFAIAKWAFVERVILPGLPGLFKGSSISNFKINEMHTIGNNGLIPLEKVSTGYRPYFDNATIKILDNKIVIINTTGRCDVVKKSSYVTFSLSGIYSVYLHQDNNIPTVRLSYTSKPSLLVDSHVDPSVWIFWILGGFTVHAIIQGIEGQMRSRAWDFEGHSLKFDIFPIEMNNKTTYKKCGLAENFYMNG